MSETIVAAHEVSKKYGNRYVLKDCSLSLFPDEVVLLTGRNGSGKSTLLKILVGLLSPGSGKITRNVRKIAFCGHASMLYEHLTVIENLQLFSVLGGGKEISREDALLELDRWGIKSTGNHYPLQISQGQRARVSLCRAFLSDSQVIVLDEPDASLDKQGVDVLTEKIRAASATILVATHHSELFEGTFQRKLKLEGQQVIE